MFVVYIVSLTLSSYSHLTPIDIFKIKRYNKGVTNSREFMETKTCTLCGETKPLTEEFWALTKGRHANGKKYFRNPCKVCRAKQQKARYTKEGKFQKNKQKKTALTIHCACCDRDLPRENFSASNLTTCKSCVLAKRWAKKYGVSVEYILGIQQAPCEVCGQEGNIHIHHDHKTNTIVGGLCMSCNVVEGHLKTSEKALNMYRFMLKHERG